MTISDQTWRAILAQRTNAKFPKLLNIIIDANADGNLSCVALTDNNTDIVSNLYDGITDMTYIYCPFEVALPPIQPGGTPKVNLIVQNVSQDLANTFDGLVTPPLINLYSINFAEPNIALASAINYFWTDLRYDLTNLSGSMSLEDFYGEPFPGDTMGPHNYPGLF